MPRRFWGQQRQQQQQEIKRLVHEAAAALWQQHPRSRSFFQLSEVTSIARGPRWWWRTCAQRLKLPLLSYSSVPFKHAALILTTKVNYCLLKSGVRVVKILTYFKFLDKFLLENAELLTTLGYCAQSLRSLAARTEDNGCDYPTPNWRGWTSR